MEHSNTLHARFNYGITDIAIEGHGTTLVTVTGPPDRVAEFREKYFRDYRPEGYDTRATKLESPTEGIECWRITRLRICD